MTRFLDTEIAPAIKLTPQNTGQNVATKYQLNGRELWYMQVDNIQQMFTFLIHLDISDAPNDSFYFTDDNWCFMAIFVHLIG